MAAVAQLSSPCHWQSWALCGRDEGQRWLPSSGWQLMVHMWYDVLCVHDAIVKLCISCSLLFLENKLKLFYIHNSRVLDMMEESDLAQNDLQVEINSF